jgi:hypothetical protein
MKDLLLALLCTACIYGPLLVYLYLAGRILV